MRIGQRLVALESSKEFELSQMLANIESFGKDIPEIQYVSVEDRPG